MKININDNVKVKLTDFGKTVHKERHDYFNKIFKENGAHELPYRKPEVDQDGYTKYQLWDLMNIYGHCLVLGHPMPFDTEIILLTDDDPKIIKPIPAEDSPECGA